MKRTIRKTKKNAYSSVTKKKASLRGGSSLHNCGNGFTGNIVSARGVSFCGFCGKEF